MIQETSQEAYLEEVKPSLKKRQQSVMEVFISKQPNDLTNNEIAHLLGWTINTVTPRVFELRGQGKLYESRRRPCLITGRKVIAWKLPDLFQDKLFK